MICIIEIENPVREIVKYIIESPRIQIIAIENRNRDIERVGLMKYKTRIFIVPTAILCALCTTAFAGNAVNEEKYFKVDGEPYKGITAIDVNSVLAQGATGQTTSFPARWSYGHSSRTEAVPKAPCGTFPNTIWTGRWPHCASRTGSSVSESRKPPCISRLQMQKPSYCWPHTALYVWSCLNSPYI